MRIQIASRIHLLYLSLSLSTTLAPSQSITWLHCLTWSANALKQCGYPKWTITKVKKDIEFKKQQPTAKRVQQKEKNKQTRAKGMVVLPYIKGTTEAIQRVLKKHGIGTSVRPHQTLRQLLVHPKDKIEPKYKSEVVYQIPCKNCDKSYIGETGRKFDIRLKEHKTEADKDRDTIYTRSTRKQSEKEITKSAIADHVRQCYHVIDWAGARVVDRESDKYKRWIHKAIWICKKAPTMN